MQREAATPPIEHTLSHLCELASLRLPKLEPSHPRRRRTKKAWSSIQRTRLEQLAKLCPQHTEYSNPLLQPELWEKHLFEGAGKCLTAAGHTTEKDKARINVINWLNLEAAITSPMISAASAIHVCLDNLSVAQAAGSIPNGSSQGAFKRFRDIAKSWQDKGKVMTVQWIPSHSDLKGNEIADSEARRFAQTPHNPLVEKTHTLYSVCGKASSQRRIWPG